MAPGNKNGWSMEQGGWVINSVGFTGPSQCYTLAVMNALGDSGGHRDGVATTTHLVELLPCRPAISRQDASFVGNVRVKLFKTSTRRRVPNHKSGFVFTDCGEHGCHVAP